MSRSIKDLTRDADNDIDYRHPTFRRLNRLLKLSIDLEEERKALGLRPKLIFIWPTKTDKC